MSNLRVNTISPRTSANIDFDGLDIPSYLGVPLAPAINPDLTGAPTADTPAVNDSSRRIATTAWTQQELTDYDTASQASLQTTLTGLRGTANPLVNGATAVVGTATKYAREDHVHPRSNLRDLADVNMTLGSLVDGDIAVWNSATSKWVRSDKLKRLLAGTEKTAYLFAGVGTGAVSSFYYLKAGTWLVTAQIVGEWFDPSNYNFDLTQTVTVTNSASSTVGLSISPAYHGQRDGGAGYGRTMHGIGVELGTFVVTSSGSLAEGSFQVAIGSPVGTGSVPTITYKPFIVHLSFVG
jgi:hypothetical protein